MSWDNTQEQPKNLRRSKNRKNNKRVKVNDDSHENQLRNFSDDSIIYKTKRTEENAFLAFKYSVTLRRFLIDKIS